MPRRPVDSACIAELDDEPSILAMGLRLQHLLQTNIIVSSAPHLLVCETRQIGTNQGLDRLYVVLSPNGMSDVSDRNNTYGMRFGSSSAIMLTKRTESGESFSNPSFYMVGRVCWWVKGTASFQQLTFTAFDGSKYVSRKVSGDE